MVLSEKWVKSFKNPSQVIFNDFAKILSQFFLYLKI